MLLQKLFMSAHPAVGYLFAMLPGMVGLALAFYVVTSEMAKAGGLG